MKKVFEEPKLEMISIYDVVANQLPPVDLGGSNEGGPGWGEL